MNITLTGSLGNTGKPLAAILVKAGHQVTVVSSNPAKASEIITLGALPAIGSVSDRDFLTKAFTGADAVYTMFPPDLHTTDYQAYIDRTLSAYVAAITAAGVPRVVNLSSIGAHLASGTGPIAGLHQVERVLDGLEGVAVRHLRAGFFYTNFYGNTAMIRHAGILGANYGTETTMMLVHPEDIAAAAAEELQQAFTGKDLRYVISDERSTQDIASTIGAAIGKPELPWVNFSDEEALAGMLQAGMPELFSGLYVEMGAAVRSGKLWEHYLVSRPSEKGAIKLEQFAAEFARVYKQQV